MHLNPRRLLPFVEGYNIRKKMRDEEMWILGQYFMSALDATVCNNALWRGKHGKANKYIEKPILQTVESNGNKEKELTEQEKKEQTEKLFMSLRLMQVNFNANHKNKDGSVS